MGSNVQLLYYSCFMGSIGTERRILRLATKMLYCHIVGGYYHFFIASTISRGVREEKKIIIFHRIYCPCRAFLLLIKRTSNITIVNFLN